MSQANVSDKQIRMNAPTYMRPQRSVLDEPLDIDAGKRITAQPKAKEVVEEIATPVPAVTAEPPVVVTNAVVEAAPEIVEAVSDAVPETAAETAPAPEPVDNQVPEAEEENPPRRKQMTVIQQVIVLLLLLVVAAFLATFYLYTHGWIELPTAVLNVIEKGLSLIQ